ncbi:MAG: 4Fe-4S dicluster domain-containing protein [Deltaproteobacteria bacterium]|nr:4Fe-4S dicluster domain-containing protein [Deltaproteobacteria bacterium]
MSRKILFVDQEKCIGCRMCEQWCSLTRFGVINPAKASIRIIRDHFKQMDRSFYCHQCEDAPCISACPPKIGALMRDEKTGAVKVDREKCVGCLKCQKACVHAAIRMHPSEKYVLICDLCGGVPQCVKHCPEKAVQYRNPDEVTDNISDCIAEPEVERG